MREVKLILLAFAPVALFLFYKNFIGQDSYLAPMKNSAPDYSEVDALYAQCEGRPFDAGCEDSGCIQPGIEQRVYSLWKERFKQIHNLSDEYFEEHIKLRDVAYDFNKFHWVRIDYVYENEWIKSRQNESINLSASKTFKSVEKMTDADIIKEVDLTIEGAEKFDAPIISWEKVQKEMKTTYKNKAFKYDFCHIDFANVSGVLTLDGWITLDQSKNECARSSINLQTGELDVRDDLCFYTL